MALSDLTPEDVIHILLQGFAGADQEELCHAHAITPMQYQHLKARFLVHAEAGLKQELAGEGLKSPSGPASVPEHAGIAFNLLIDSIPHAVFAKDLQGNFIYGNPTYCNLMGVSQEALIGMDDFDIHTPESAEKFRADDKMVTDTGELFRCVEDNPRLDGKIAQTEVVKAPLRDGQGKTTGMIGMFWDVTEQYNIQRALERSEAKLRQLIEHAPLPICVFTPKGEAMHLNSAFTDLFGPAQENVKDLDHFWRIICPDGALRGPLKAGLRSCLVKDGGQDEATATYEFQDLSGKRRHIQITAADLQDNLMLIMSDITQLKEAEEELRQSRENLEQTVDKRTRELLEANSRLMESNKFKTMIMSSVSHELRTPLTSILGFAAMIRRDIAAIAKERNWSPELPPHAARLDENASIIAKEGKRLKRLIDDLLDLNRIESGEMVWQDQDMDMAQVALDSFKTMLGEFASSPSVMLRQEIPPGPVPVHADPDKVKQVFINLLNNAAKFTEQGEVTVSLSMVDGWAQGCVMDTGPGISEQDIAHIFETYYQGSDPNGHCKGAGLGLSISRQIVTRYGGKLWVESTLGRGTSFFFRLPLAGA